MKLSRRECLRSSYYSLPTTLERKSSWLSDLEYVQEHFQEICSRKKDYTFVPSGGFVEGNFRPVLVLSKARKHSG